MSTENTIQMLELYRQQTRAPAFLTGMFQSPARNFHNSQDVEVDIIREDEEVAVTVADITSSARMNQATKLTNKRFTPPVYKEAGPINAYELMLRAPGQDPFMSPEYQANAQRASLEIGRRCEEKIRRAVELMAAQVLQTGQLTLKNSDGVNVFTMDFHPKAAHLQAVGTAWSVSATATPLLNIENICNTIFTNGRERPTDLIMGRTAYLEFMRTDEVKGIADNRRYNLVRLDAPQLDGAGGIYQGTLSTGAYNLNIWTYDAKYKDVETGTLTDYVDPGKVIVLNPSSRRDLTWGNIPTIGGRDPRALPFMPGRVNDSGNRVDLHYNAWVEKDNTGVTVQVASRPLTIPTAIDTSGCLTV